MRRLRPSPARGLAPLAVLLALALGVVAPSAALAQAAPLPAAGPEPSGPSPVSPGGAFLRAVLLPGWGHASIGSYTRGGFYFLLESTAAFGLVKTHLRLSEARDRADFRERVLRARFEADGVPEEEIEGLLEEDATLEDLQGLVGAREQQQEDWLAFGIFLLFLSGADAFVSAHLQDFPVPLDVQAAPAGGGGLELSVGIGVGR